MLPGRIPSRRHESSGSALVLAVGVENDDLLVVGEAKRGTMQVRTRFVGDHDLEGRPAQPRGGRRVARDLHADSVRRAGERAECLACRFP